MRRLLVVVLVVAGLFSPKGSAAEPRGELSHHTLPATADYPSRDYLEYVPGKLAPPPGRALVVYLHGCTQTAEEAARGTRWDELADARGFIVAFPDQHVPTDPTDTDGSPAGCWNPGQGEASDRGAGELASVAQITRTVAREQRVNPRHVYVVGISGGAMMASAMAVVYPDLFAGVGHVANAGYVAEPTGTVAYRRMGPLARIVPVIDIQGSADDVVTMGLEEQSVQEWLGTDDWADNGHLDGSIARTPSSVENRGVGALTPSVPGELCLRDFPRNPCPGGVLGSYPVTIRDYTDGNGALVLQAWTIHGLMHNYSGGSTAGTFTDPYGPNITPLIFDFLTTQS
jgi:poly(hydroxyalkanoate) depolymerase family esterase